MSAPDIALWAVGNTTVSRVRSHRASSPLQAAGAPAMPFGAALRARRTPPPRRTAAASAPTSIARRSGRDRPSASTPRRARAARPGRDGTAPASPRRRGGRRRRRPASTGTARATTRPATPTAKASSARSTRVPVPPGGLSIQRQAASTDRRASIRSRREIAAAARTTPIPANASAPWRSPPMNASQRPSTSGRTAGSARDATTHRPNG